VGVSPLWPSSVWPSYAAENLREFPPTIKAEPHCRPSFDFQV